MEEVYSSEFNWWQKLASKYLGMWRINRDSIDFKWGYFAPRPGIALLLNMGGYESQRVTVSFCLGWGYLQIKLPFKTRSDGGFDHPRYGFQMHHDTLWVHKGASDLFSWYLPFFSWHFDWHRCQLADGSWIDYHYDKRDQFYTEKHPYTYKLNSGEIQNRIATCTVEERQWHRKWLPFVKMRNRIINVKFDGEVGEKSGSWKGGVCGCGYDLLPNESIESCLRRMEREEKF